MFFNNSLHPRSSVEYHLYKCFFVILICLFLVVIDFGSSLIDQNKHHTAYLHCIILLLQNNYGNKNQDAATIKENNNLVLAQNYVTPNIKLNPPPSPPPKQSSSPPTPRSSPICYKTATQKAHNSHVSRTVRLKAGETVTLKTHRNPNKGIFLSTNFLLLILVPIQTQSNKFAYSSKGTSI